MECEWDAEKAATNFKKHGVAFSEAATVFGDPLAAYKPDPDHSSVEDRWLVMGQSRKNGLLIVAFTEGHGVLRLISARCLTNAERRVYEEETYG